MNAISNRVRACVETDPAVDTEDLLQDAWLLALEADREAFPDATPAERNARVYTGDLDQTIGDPDTPAMSPQDEAAANHGESPGYSFREHRRVRDAVDFNRGDLEAAFTEITNGSDRVKKRRMSRDTFYALAAMDTYRRELSGDPAIMDEYGYEGMRVDGTAYVPHRYPDPGVTGDELHRYFSVPVADALDTLTTRQRDALYQGDRRTGGCRRAAEKVREVLTDPRPDADLPRQMLTTQVEGSGRGGWVSPACELPRGNGDYDEWAPTTVVRRLPARAHVKSPVKHADVKWTRTFTRTRWYWVQDTYVKSGEGCAALGIHECDDHPMASASFGALPHHVAVSG